MQQPTTNRGYAGGSFEDFVSLRLAGDVNAAAMARGALAHLDGDLDDTTLETVCLLATELVTNSVRHAGAPEVDVEVRVTRPAVRLEVRDPGPGFTPSERPRNETRESGWGLHLVDRLSDRWGVSGEPGDTRVWLELDRQAA